MRQHWRVNWKSHLGTVVLAAVVLISVQTWQTRDVPGGPAPDFVLTLVQPDGTSTQSTLHAWRARHPGQPVALHFWADWCPICRTEENSISRLTTDWPVLTVAMQSGPAVDVARVMRQRQLPWNTTVDERGTVMHRYGFKGVPAFVVIDAHGRLRTPSMGYTTEIGMRLRLWWASLTSLLDSQGMAVAG
ncbi:MAG: alkyl hydroperoxide reductase [Burkholderiales bacterium RIFOXYC12_FULL_60_6]|nr:MAG: alkyl hydroperoxide reductase [Burkholderiales bacterium RIFOXYD12_FULL_59_19]OGB75666.1 MAG: alkyl hydroperoxide reductase [Burkholderiales bacterium RIFOXYC12_FULL_60_6]